MEIKTFIRTLQVNSCRKVTGLIEKEKVFGLNTLEKLLLDFHLRICDDCPKYKKHSEMIDQILASPNAADLPMSVNADFVLPESVKLKIFRDIEKSS